MWRESIVVESIEWTQRTGRREREREHVERDVTVRPRSDAGGQTDRQTDDQLCGVSRVTVRVLRAVSVMYIYYHVRGCNLTPSF